MKLARRNADQAGDEYLTLVAKRPLNALQDQRRIDPAARREDPRDAGNEEGAGDVTPMLFLFFKSSTAARLAGGARDAGL